MRQQNVNSWPVRHKASAISKPNDLTHLRELRQNPRMAAPKGNVNAMRTGVRAKHLGLGRFPKDRGMVYLQTVVKQVRNDLLDELEQVHGEVTRAGSLLIRSYCRHEARALLVWRLLRDRWADLSVTERLSMLDAISKATASGDAVLKQLGLDARQRDSNANTIAAYYSRVDDNDDGGTETDTHGSDDDDDEAAEHETPGGPPVGPAAGTG
jgi:hypothetical protein